MRNLRLSLNLLMPHIFISALLVLGVIANIISLNNIREQTEALYDGPLAIKSAAGTVYEALEAMQTSVYRAISTDTPDITDEATSDARDRATVLQEQITQLKQHAIGDTSALSRLETNLSELARMQEYVLNLAVQNNDAEALAYMENSGVPLVNEAEKELARFVQSAEAEEGALVASLRQTQRKAVIFLIALCTAGAVFAVRDGIYFWRLYKELRQSREPYQSIQMK